MNYRTKKFVPIPRSFADIESFRQMAQGINSLLNGQIRTGSNLDYHVSDGNVMWVIPSTSQFQTFVVVSDGGDYYNCNTFDGTNIGSTIIKVAKNQDLRCILPSADPSGGAWPQKTIRGITYTYVYTATVGFTTDGVNVLEYVRSVSGSDGSTETDNVTPCLNVGTDENVGDIISAFSTSFTAPETLKDVIWQALADGRAWAAQPPS